MLKVWDIFQTTCIWPWPIKMPLHSRSKCFHFNYTSAVMAAVPERKKRKTFIEQIVHISGGPAAFVLTLITCQDESPRLIWMTAVSVYHHPQSCYINRPLLPPPPKMLFLFMWALWAKGESTDAWRAILASYADCVWYGGVVPPRRILTQGGVMLQWNQRFCLMARWHLE